MNRFRSICFALILSTLYVPAAFAVGEMSSAPSEAVAAVAEVPVAEDAPSGDLTPGRAALYESAMMYEAGHGAWTSLDVGVHRFDYGVTDNLQIGVTALLPIGVFAVVPELKVGGEIAERLHLSVTARAGTALAPGLSQMIGFGGHVALTYGTPDLHITAGTHAYGLSLLDSDAAAVGWAVHPTLGGVARVSDYAVLHADAGPIVIGSNVGTESCGPDCVRPVTPEVALWVVKYGVRFHGDAWFGDVSFVIPVHEAWSEVAAYLPLGLPTLTLGYAF